MLEAGNHASEGSHSQKDGSGVHTTMLLATPSGTQEQPARDKSDPPPGLKKNKTTESMNSRWSRFSMRSTVDKTSSKRVSNNKKKDRMSMMSVLSSVVKDHSLLRLGTPKSSPISKHLSVRSGDIDLAAYSDPLAEAETILMSAQLSSRLPSPSSSCAVQQTNNADARAAVQHALNPETDEAESSMSRVEMEPSEAQSKADDRAAGSKVYQQMRTWADREMNSQLTDICFDGELAKERGSTKYGQQTQTVNFDDLVSAKKKMDTQKAQREARFLVKPGSKMLTAWRTTMVFVVLWAVLMAPLEIAFSWWTPPTVFKVMGYMVDILCIIDMLMNFITGRIAHGRVVTNHSQIAISYLRTWFVVDFLTNFLWDKVMASNSGKSRKVVKILKLPKIVRLTRLLRVAREEAHTFGTFFTLAGFLLLAHYYSCLWVELLVDCGEDSAQHDCPPVLETYGTGLSVGMAILGGNDAWMRFSMERQGATGSVNGFEWKSGFGIDLASVITCLTGFCAMGMLFANIARAMDRQDSHSRKFNERLWRIKAAKNQYGMTHELYVRARKHFHFVWSCGSDASRALLEDHTLSPDLRRELSHSFYGDLLRKVPFLAMAEDHLVKQLCGYARMEVFSPHDKIIMAGECGTELFFLVSGAVQVQKPDDGELLRQLDEGSFFGEMALFNPESQRTVDVVGCSFGWLLVVSLVVLRELCSEDLMEAFRTVAVERNHFFPQHLAEQTELREEADHLLQSSDFDTLVANTYINSKMTGDGVRRWSEESGDQRESDYLDGVPGDDIGHNGNSGHSIYLRRSCTEDGGDSQQESRGSRLDSDAVAVTKTVSGKEVSFNEMTSPGASPRSSETNSHAVIVPLLTSGTGGRSLANSETEAKTKNPKVSEKGESPRSASNPEKCEAPRAAFIANPTALMAKPKLNERRGADDTAPVSDTQKAVSSPCDRHQDVSSHCLDSRNIQSTLERLELKLDKLAKIMDRRLSRLEERMPGPTAGHSHGHHHHHHHDHNHLPRSGRSSLEKQEGHGVLNLALNDQLRTAYRSFGSDNRAASPLPSAPPVSKFHLPNGARRWSHHAGHHPGHHDHAGHHAHHAHHAHLFVKPTLGPPGGPLGANHPSNRQLQIPDGNRSARSSLLSSAQDPSAKKLKEFLKENDLEEAIPKGFEVPPKGRPDHAAPPEAEPVRLLPQPAAAQLDVNQECVVGALDSAADERVSASELGEQPAERRVSDPLGATCEASCAELVSQVDPQGHHSYDSESSIRSEYGQSIEGAAISLPNATSDEIR